MPSARKLLGYTFASVQYQRNFLLSRLQIEQTLHCPRNLVWKPCCLSDYTNLPYTMTIFRGLYIKRPSTFNKRIYLGYPVLTEYNRLYKTEKNNLVYTHAFSRHVYVCCRREPGAEYISTNEKLFYISYHMTERLKKRSFSGKKILFWVSFFLRNWLKLLERWIAVEFVTKA